MTSLEDFDLDRAEGPPVSVVVPCRHEAANVHRLHEELRAHLGRGEWELLFIDDSDDETVVELAALAEAEPRVRFIHREQGRRDGGLGGAVVLGVQEASHDVIAVMDADLQHPASAVAALLREVDVSGADLAVGTRYRGAGSSSGLDGPWRVLVSRACRRLVHASLPRTRCVSDPLGGLFVLRRHVVDGVVLRPDGFKILLELLVRGRWRSVREVPYAFQPRLAGASKSGLAEGFRFLRHLRSLRTQHRLRHTASAAGHPGELVPETGTGVPTTPLNVLVLTSEAPPVTSGISTTVATLTEGLRERGHQVAVVSRSDFPRFIRREVRLSAFALFWPRFRHHLGAIDVVNVHGPVPSISESFLLFMAGQRGLRPAIVYTHHSDLAIAGLERWCRVYNVLTGRLTSVADTVVVSSQDYREKIQERWSADVEVIPWGVAPRAEIRPRALSTGRLRVLFVGQMRSYKGIDVLLRATDDLADVDLTLIGDGPLRETYEAAAAASGSRARFLGRVDDDALWTAYAEHDVVVLPSTTTAEAYGMVLAEGMLAGCVPVASDLPGVREVAGPTGRLVVPGDAEDLRRALAELAAEPGLLASLRVASLRRSADFTGARTAAEYERVLARAVRRSYARQAHLALPGADDPRSFLSRLQRDVSGGEPSLLLLPRRAAVETAPLLWTAAGEPHRVPSAPVATYVAKTQRPVVIGEGHSVDLPLRMLLRRPEVLSSVVIPVHRTPRTTSVLSIATHAGDEAPLGREDLRRVLDRLVADGHVRTLDRQAPLWRA